MGMDFAVNRQRHKVPAHIAALAVRAVVQLHIQQGIGLQALLRGNLIVLNLPRPKCCKGGFLCGGDDLRVIPYQSGVDKLVLHLCGFGFRR